MAYNFSQETIDYIKSSKDLINNLTPEKFRDFIRNIRHSSANLVDEIIESGLAYKLMTHLTELADYTFEYAGAKTSITIPSSISKIGKECFATSKFTSIIFEEPSHVTEIGENAFRLCTRLQELVLPNGLKSFDNQKEFPYCIKKMWIPLSCTRLGHVGYINDNIKIFTPRRYSAKDKLVCREKDIPFYKEHLKFLDDDTAPKPGMLSSMN